MTALERALVVYAEAKGYEIEYKNANKWEPVKYKETYRFDVLEYRIKNREDERKVYDELSDFFKPLYAPEQPSKLLSDMERVKYKPAGFSCNAKYYTREEIGEMNKPKEEIPESHKFTLDMKFKVGDKVKVKPNFKDNNIYEVCGFEYFTHARGQCSGIRYQMVDSEGECGHWAREDALELYKPEPTPATEEELEEIKAEDNNCFWVKDKIQGITITWKFVRSADVSDSFFVLDISPKPGRIGVRNDT